jgi:hypothetical protein
VEAIRALPIEAALEDLVQAISGFPPEHTKLVLARLGLDGESPDPGHVARVRSGPAVERVQQLEQRFLRLIPKVAIYLPQLDAALAVLDEAAPCALSAASQLLRARNLGRGIRNVDMVLAAGRLFARRVTVEIDPTRRKLVRGRRSG